MLKNLICLGDVSRANIRQNLAEGMRKEDALMCKKIDWLGFYKKWKKIPSKPGWFI